MYEGDVGRRLNALLHDVAADNGGPQVVLAFRLPYELQPGIAGRLEPTLDFFSKDSGRSVIFVLEPPILPFAPILCVGMPPLRPKIQTACQLPVSELKIDRAFIDKIDSSPGTQKLVKAMIEMGHGMDLVVTAEGVETQAEKDTITRLGCDVMQGYFGSRPLHGAALAAWYDSL